MRIDVDKIDAVIDLLIKLNSEQTPSQVDLVHHFEQVAPLTGEARQQAIDTVVTKIIKAELRKQAAYTASMSMLGKDEINSTTMRSVSDQEDFLYGQELTQLPSDIKQHVDYVKYLKKAEELVDNTKLRTVAIESKPIVSNNQTNRQSGSTEEYLNAIIKEIWIDFSAELNNCSEDTYNAITACEENMHPHLGEFAAEVITCARIAFLKFRAVCEQKGADWNFHGMSASEFYITALMVLNKILCDKPYDNSTFKRLMEISLKSGQINDFPELRSAVGPRINQLDVILLQDLGLIDYIVPRKDFERFTENTNNDNIPVNESDDFPEKPAPDTFGLKKLFFQVANQKNILVNTPNTSNSNASFGSADSSHSSSSSSSSVGFNPNDLSLYRGSSNPVAGNSNSNASSNTNANPGPAPSTSSPKKK